MSEDTGRYAYNFYEPGTRGHSAKSVFGYDDDDEPEPDETMIPTDLQLQLALAKELPELIEHTIGTGGRGVFGEHYFLWKDTQLAVTPREWDWIARECEKALTAEQWYVYYSSLPLNDPQKSHNKWQTRAVAYFETIGKEIA